MDARLPTSRLRINPLREFDAPNAEGFMKSFCFGRAEECRRFTVPRVRDTWNVIRW